MRENIRLSLQGIWSHKLRSFLTMLGIIIGIAAIIAIVSTIEGTNEQIKQNLIGSGNNTVKIMLYQDDWEYDTAYDGMPNGIMQPTQEELDRILEFPDVNGVSLYNKREGGESIFYKNNSLSGGSVYGIDDTYFQTCKYVVKKGRGFADSDYDQFRKVAILDEDAVSTMFQAEDPVGKTIEIKSEPFIVIGVVGPQNDFEPTINTIDDYYTYMGESGGKVYITEAAWPIVYNYDEPQNVLVQAINTDAMSNVGKEAAAVMNETVDTSQTNVKYQAEDLLKQAEEIQAYSQSTNMMLIWIAGISLIVGGIGVMNIMLVSVTERTQEIGLKKAIGAQKIHILGQFLTEAAVLTSTGGIIGVVAGIVLAEIISKLVEIPVAISVPYIIIAVVFSMVIGIVFGLLPSYKAANLNPIDALRRE